MPRIVVGILLTALVAFAAPVSAGNVPLEVALAERVLGDPKAPVTVFEFSSLSCSHCAAFHKDTLPRIKKEYIDTGKVKLVFRDFPLGGLALAAAMLARCSGTERYFGFLDAIFQSQPNWSRSDTPRDDLGKLARLAGMSEDDVDACLENEKLQQTIVARAKAAQNKYGINSTPTFIIEGKKVPGNLPFKDFKDILDKELKKKQ